MSIEPIPHWKHNPWGLTEKEVKSIAAFIEHGSVKGACKALSRSHYTINVHCERARAKMHKLDAGVAGSRVRYLILFDRWARGEVHA